MNMGAPMGYYPNQSQGYGASGGWSQPMSMNGYVPNQAYYQPGYQQAYQNGNRTTVVTQQPRTYMPESPWYSVWRDSSGYNRYAWQPIGNGIDDGGMSTASFGGQPTQGAYPSVPTNPNDQQYFFTPTNVRIKFNFDGLRNYMAQNPQPMMATGDGGFDLSSLASMFGNMMGARQQATTATTRTQTRVVPVTHPLPPPPVPKLMALKAPVATAIAV